MSREDFKSFVVTDPNLVDQQLDVSKLATTTPTRKELLGGISTLPGVKYDPTLQSSFTDLLAYFSGGLPRLPQTPTASNVNVPLPGGSGGGGGGITAVSTVQPTAPKTTAPFVETSPNVLSATDSATGQPTSGNIVDPKTGDVFAPGDYSDVAGTLADPREKIDFTPEQQGTIQNILGQAGQTVSGALSAFGNIPGAIVDAANQTVDLFGKKINVGKTLASAAINKIAGGPVNLIFEAAKAVLPERDPRQNKLDDLYDVKDGTIQSGLMAGYNPVSGGIPGISDPTYGLQDAYDKRIGTIENTLKDKYNMSDAEIADVKAGSYKGDVDTNLLDTLTDLEDAKKKEADVLGITAAEDKRLGEAEMRQTIADAVRQRDLGITAAGDKRLGEAKMKQTIADAVRQRDLGITAAEDKRLGEAKMKQTIADAELLQSNYEKIRDSGGDDISFEEYIENLKRSPPIPGQYEDMIDTDNPFAKTIQERVDEYFDMDPAVPYDIDDDIRQESPKLGVGSDYDKDFETYLLPDLISGETLTPQEEAATVTGIAGPPRQISGPQVMDQPAANNINITAGLPTYETLPEGASKTGTPVDALNPINRQQHFDNTEKLKDAVRAGKISNETYNRLSAFDARKTMGLGPVTGTGASALYQGTQSLFGISEAVADQPFGEAVQDTIRNIQGVSGNITPEEQVQYQEIISGQDIYRDPILGMVDQPTRGTLAGEPGLPSLMDEFDMTAFDEPISEPTPMRQRLDELRRERDLGVGPQFMDMAESGPLTNTQLAEMPMQEFENLLNNTGNDLGKAFDLIEARQEGKEYLDDLEEIGKDVDYIGYTEQEKADIAAGKKVPQLGELLDFGLDQIMSEEPEPDRGGPPSVISRPDPSPPPSFTPRGGGADRDPAPAPKSTPTFTPRGGGADRDPAPSRPAPSRPNYGPPSQSGGGGGGGGGGCFLKGTQVTMADGSTKSIEQVDLGDKVAKGGKVFATGKFLVKNLHDYKGIKVSGSHMVSEDGNWVRVEDSKHGKTLGDDEHTVYVFGAENRRILIDDILFTDYFEVNEQEKLSEGDKFFDNWKIHAKVDSDSNVNIINAS